ncbi:hypothetical protein ACF3NA_10380 [Alkanindiges sp. WGS2144]|uniref:hypothetical protein n=1 Tax=Alkanindiges sp. WGS2144 TaxID=3366808 RepID=UPI00375247E1
MKLKQWLMQLMVCVLVVLTSQQGQAIEIATEGSGKLDIGGAVRAKYQYREFAQADKSKLEFADSKLVISYSSPTWLAYADYRCYRMEELCDLSMLVDAWMGYQFNPQQQLSIGMMPVPFGPGQYWGSTYYEGTAYNLGLEDTHNPGIKYQYKTADNELSLGFYPRDGRNYIGQSNAASRFSANLVQADDLDNGTAIEERNMLIGRISHHFEQSDELDHTLGASYWHSSLDNKQNGQSGQRDAWNVFGSSNWKQWNTTLVAGQHRLDNKDLQMPDSSTFGAFDYAYNIANDYNFYSAELSYRVAEPYGKLSNIKPYLNYSVMDKKPRGFATSQRLISGVGFNYGPMGIFAEYMIGKNDAMVGGDASSYAQGSDDVKWKKLLYISIGYYF